MSEGASSGEDRAVVNGAGQAVSALRASAPSAADLASLLLAGVTARAKVLNEASQEHLDAVKLAKTQSDKDFRLTLSFIFNTLSRAACDEAEAIGSRAQAIKARRAETLGGSVHESAVGNADAPQPDPTSGGEG